MPEWPGFNHASLRGSRRSTLGTRHQAPGPTIQTLNYQLTNSQPFELSTINSPNPQPPRRQRLEGGSEQDRAAGERWIALFASATRGASHVLPARRYQKQRTM